MPTNTKEYQSEYMKKYNLKRNNVITCDICGSQYKEYNKYKHIRTRKHVDRINYPKLTDEFEKSNGDIDTFLQRLNDMDERVKILESNNI